MSANTLRLELLLNAGRATAAMRQFSRDSTRELGNISRQTQKLTRAFNGLSTATKLFATAGGLVVSRQLLMGMNELERAMLRVESNLIGGAKSANDLHKQLQSVRDTARELSKITVFSDAQMIDTTNQLLKSGVKEKDVYGTRGAAMAAAGLAQLGGVTPEVAASALGSTASAFGMDGKRIYDFADHIVKADDASGENSGQLLYNWQQANANTALLHLNPKKIISALAYSDTLMNEGGTALNRLLENLAAPTKQKRKAMKSSHMDFWNEGKDGSVKLKSPEEFFEIIRKRYRNAKDERAMIVELHKIFGEEGGKLAALIASKPKPFAEFDKQVENSTGMQKKLEIQSRGLSAAFERLKNSILSALDNEFAPARNVMTTGTNLLTSVIDKGQDKELLGAGAGLIGLAALYKLNKNNKGRLVTQAADKASKLHRIAEAARIQKVFVTNWPSSMLTPGEKVRRRLGQNDGSPDMSGEPGASNKSSKLQKLGKGLSVISAGAMGWEIGENIVKPLIDSAVQFFTNNENATLGTAIYDMLHQSKIDTGGELKIIIDDQRTRVSSLKSNDPRQTINVDTGAAMVHAR